MHAPEAEHEGVCPAAVARCALRPIPPHTLASADAPGTRERDVRERRAAVRVPIRAEVGLDTETHFFTGYTEDLSDGGLFVATYNLLSPGVDVAVSFVLPEGRTVAVDGQVAWVRDPPDSAISPGLGIRLDALAPDDKDAILRFLCEREAIFYDL